MHAAGRKSLVSLALLLLVAPVPVFAADPKPTANATANATTTSSEVEDLVKRGNDLRRAGDDQSALPLLAKAYERAPTPRNAVQLGLVEQALGRWADSDLHLTEAMKMKPGEDAWIDRNRGSIIEALNRAKGHVARVEITGEPVGAEVLVGGRSVGHVPLDQPVRVSAGNVDVELRAPGYRSALRSLRVAGGQYQPVVIRLERGSGPALPATAFVPGAEAGTTAALGDEGLRASSASPGSDSVLRLWAERGAWAGSAVSLGFGAYQILGHNRDVKKFNERGCFESDTGPYLDGGNGGSDDLECKGLADRYDSARKLAFTGFIAAGAFAATGLVLHLLAPDRDEQSRAHARATSCAPRLDGLGLVCASMF